MTRICAARRRGGFTLVELLVAIALAILLLSLIVGVTSSGTLGSYRVVGSADRVSGWLLIAKSRAVRDGRVHGVRFSGTGNQYREAQYIEERLMTLPERSTTRRRFVFSYEVDTATPPNITSRRCFVVAGPEGTSPSAPAFPCDAGDILIFPTLGGSYRVTAISPPVSELIHVRNNGSDLYLRGVEVRLADYPDLGAGSVTRFSATATRATLVTDEWGVHHRPVPLLGEPVMLLPADTAIEGNNSLVNGVSITAPTFDILFTPSGQAMVANSTNPQPRPADGLIALWVRDPNRPAWPAAGAGEQVLIGVYPKTGTIATHPPAPAPADKYQFLRDGLGSGL